MIDFKEKYSNIIESGNSEQLIALLKVLNEQSRKELAPLIKKDVKRLTGHKEISRNRWGVIGSENQFKMLGVAILCCYNKKDCKNIKSVMFKNNNYLDIALGLFSPDWFTDYVNIFADKDGCPFNYEQISDWIAAGYLSNVSPMLIVKKIIHSKMLQKHSFTLDVHLWEIFNYPCNISWAESWHHTQEKPEDADDHRWIYLLKKYAQQKRLDRIRVLKESLLAVNRGFNKNQTNWYVDLLTALEPAENECLQLQNELFSVFHCPQNKPISYVLKIINSLSANPEFDYDAFINHLPLIFSSTIKSTLNSTLILADKLASKYPDKRMTICHNLTGVFINKDASLQEKAAKLIVKYGDPTDAELSALLDSYINNLLAGTKQLLTDFLDSKPPVADEALLLHPVISLIRDDNRIPEIESWDDFVFLAGRACLNLESYHFDLFPAALLRFAPEINKDNLSQLEPAFGLALKTLQSGSSSVGAFDQILATFILEFAGYLLNKLPNENILKKYNQYLELINNENKNLKLNWGFHEWQKSTKAKFQPWIDILINVLHSLQKSNHLPLLSTPTHLPCFIDPCTLVQRLRKYQKVTQVPDNLDLQLAIQRCVIPENEINLAGLNQNDTALLKYFFHGDVKSLKCVENDDLALSAIITRNTSHYDLASFEYGLILLSKNNLPANIISNEFSWCLETKTQTVPYSKEIVCYKQLNFDISRYWQQEKTRLFYAFSFMKTSNGWETDKQRLLFSFPAAHDLFLVRFIEYHFKTEYNEPRDTIHLLQAMLELPLPLTPMGHLLTAFCMLHADKTVRALAGELWIEKLRYPQGVNSAHIGDILGRLEKESWSPLKRFTDLAMQSLINISSRHNQALLEMISAMDSHLSTVKITNYKKLTGLRQELEAAL
ncbi:hypothetical protein HVY96_14775 [Escherichia fergusonii]|uniref:DUF6493 family protein n=2 Tax=Escherichia fergusonii TaxID=564 RepID=UPI0015E95479|nr:DUF6493 family protein [Escherichia fergusonii]EGO8188592.1 hypothetical protein [Escherichia fergusonii]MBV7579300.1 hypothetical protein [Escherichia fergusonii]QME63902.1 hypothetical protein HVZ09_14445 [Escherichia fergusonii]QME68510.1 hypothetical protein HVZ08_14445 [Escherichia fergusonii]QMF00215.1 hypothetical protein HVY96_14775 [Escherichia fergusonii]